MWPLSVVFSMCADPGSPRNMVRYFSWESEESVKCVVSYDLPKLKGKAYAVQWEECQGYIIEKRTTVENMS